MSRPRFAIVALCLAGASTGAAYAHHGWSTYDEAKQTKLTLPVEKVSFGNPHAEMWSTRDGKPVYVILSPPARMVERGLTSKDLTVGKTVTVDVQPSTSSQGEWKALAITVDGKTVNLMR
jgi:hypothetical protein